MKITYEFLSDDEGERKVFEMAPRYHTALWDIYQAIRCHLKYDSTLADEVIENIRELVLESGVLEVDD